MILHLPVSEATLQKFQESEPAQVIETLTIHELAACIVISKLPAITAPNKTRVVEQALAQLISEANQIGLREFRAQLSGAITRRDLNAGKAYLRDSIQLMSQEEVAKRNFLYKSGEYRWNHQVQASGRKANIYLAARTDRGTYLSDDQDRILNQIMSDPDESVDVQGYAGTGKTRLVAKLTELLDKGNVLLLAMTYPQLLGLTSRIPNQSNITGKTFGNLADEILESNLLDPTRRVGDRKRRKFSLSFPELARQMGYRSLGKLSPQQVAEVVNKTVNAFCYTQDTQILERHIPKYVLPKIQGMQTVIVQMAEELWETITGARVGPELPIKGYHRIKRLALLRERIPRRYTHIIMDESHDLPAPVIEILERSPQAVITLGDRYQARMMTGNTQRRSPNIRSRTMNHSLRAGDNASDLYNGIIQHHPVTPQARFIGSEEKSTEITYYDSFRVPDKYCAILAPSCWHILSVMQLLAVNQSAFNVLPGALGDLKWLVEDAIAFYRYRIRPSHRDLQNFASWEDYVQKQTDPVVMKVHKLFEAGYEEKHFQETLSKAGSSDPAKSYMLGRIDDARNLEFDRVMIIRSSDPIQNNDRHHLAETINRLYTGISRAKKELIVPGYLKDWLTDQAANSKR
ncbi:hypothetical protein BTA51_03635 [Hahella sp. CCB-MM4]|uniref:hypothetical protein n=1 Tax=Hahella sp. (strain CCB-MM4) TaxID=1926491 RepID=UPI000B9BBBC5|nr:hypothetical protein [Hahella sp. CCB-MM4]OZG74127.1 hypothetical protein BTA51_03635 [Hahella sp. CCB-MM4]